MAESFVFQRKKTSTFRNQAYEAIRDAIIKGNLKPGARLIENDISEQMGISRGPLREALRQLEQDGFIVSNPYRETRVAEISPEIVEMVYVPIRRIIERYAAIKAHSKFTKTDYDHLETIVEQMKDASLHNDLEKISELDYDVHQYIVGKAGGHGLKTIWKSIMNRIFSRFLLQGIQHASLDNVVSEHNQFISLLKEGDTKKIDNHLLKHIT